jgi:sulfatase maturation enzyme AslB (radical SAM superfamily)
MDKIKGDIVKKINGKFESKYYYDSENVFKELNEVSESFCLAKWYNVSIHIPTGRTHSCYHPRSHHIPIEEIKIDVSALHNTKYKKEQRKLMLEGKRPSECNFCWQIEDSGNQLSDRAYRSKDVYEKGLIEEALSLGAEGNPNPRYVEVNFNQACNFRCSYCSPHLSTAWQQDVEKNGPFILKNRWHNDLTWVKGLNIDNGPDNPYLKAFWEWLPQVYPTLQTFRMTGGEPLMDKNTFRMFDYIKEHPKKDLNLSITSNCCPPKGQWKKFMNSINDICETNSIDHFMLFCSLDSWGEQAEYIRDGMEFDVLYNNICDFLNNGKKHSLTFIITFNALSYTGFKKYIEHILNLRKQFNRTRQLIWFDVPQLIDPDFLNPKLIPHLVSELEDTVLFMKQNIETDQCRFKGFKDFEISKIQRLIDWIKSDSEFDRPVAMENFYLFFSQYDQRRGTNILNTFPELEFFWKECEEKCKKAK